MPPPPRPCRTHNTRLGTTTTRREASAKERAERMAAEAEVKAAAQAETQAKVGRALLGGTVPCVGQGARLVRAVL